MVKNGIESLNYDEELKRDLGDRLTRVT